MNALGTAGAAASAAASRGLSRNTMLVSRTQADSTLGLGAMNEFAQVISTKNDQKRDPNSLSSYLPNIWSVQSSDSKVKMKFINVHKGIKFMNNKSL